VTPPVWPLLLPQRLDVAGYEVARPDNVLRTRMRSGDEKRRRLFERARYPLRGTMQLDDRQVVSFETFYSIELADGALDFLFPSPDRPGTRIVVGFAAQAKVTALSARLRLLTLDLTVRPW
jgi:hypothetical protein